MKKKLLKWTIIALIILLVVAVLIIYLRDNWLNVVGAGALLVMKGSEDIREDALDNQEQVMSKYKPYMCYDYHIGCLNEETLEKTVAAKRTTLIDVNGYESETWARYKKIAGVDDSKFIYAQLSDSLMSKGYAVIMQNPEDYVDIFKEWTITKIEFLYGKDYSSDGTPHTSVIPEKTVSVTEDKTIIENFKNSVLNDKIEQELTYPTSDVGEYELDSKHNYYVRVHFAESENIIWETRVYNYVLEGYDDYVYIDVGKAPVRLCQDDKVRASIANYPEIYNWLSDCFANIDA